MDPATTLLHLKVRAGLLERVGLGIIPMLMTPLPSFLFLPLHSGYPNQPHGQQPYGQQPYGQQPQMYSNGQPIYVQQPQVGDRGAGGLAAGATAGLCAGGLLALLCWPCCCLF